MKDKEEFELEDFEKQKSQKSKKIIVYSILLLFAGLSLFTVISGYLKEKVVDEDLGIFSYTFKKIDVLKIFHKEESKYPGLDAKIRNALLAVEKISKRPPEEDYLPYIMFKELPLFPKDFYAKRVLYRYGLIEMDPNDITPEYWKQPEWFPRFEESTLNLLQNAPVDRYGVCCFGIYPADAFIKLEVGETEPYTFTKYTLIRSAPLVELYQGVRLDSYYPKEGKVEKDITPWQENPKIEFVQDPEIAKKYIHISIDPEQFLLDPSFPIYKREYIKLITMAITIDPEIPKGNYIVGFDTVAPDEGVSKEWMLKYPGGYNDARMGMFFSPRQYRLFITIE